MVALIEGLYLSLLSGMSGDKEHAWAETLVEANFLEMTVFAKSETDDDEYMLEVLQRIQKLLVNESFAIEEAAKLAG
jgi:hypothetical protein